MSFAIHRFAKMARMRNERPIISFTFDDFPRSAALIGAKILEKYCTWDVLRDWPFCGQVVDGVAQYRAEDLSRYSAQGTRFGVILFIIDVYLP
jgi:hypothetical protein